MRDVITVAPADSGWAVLHEGAEPWLFRSGAQAEWSARRLGEVLAESGRAVEVRILLRNGQLGGRFVWDPTEAAGQWRRARELEPA